MTNQNIATIPQSSHPRALWVLSIIYTTFTFAFGVQMTNLLVRLNTYYGLSETASFNLFAAFMSLAYTLPVLGGYLCDRFGFRNSAVIGLLFSAIGMLTLALPGFHTMMLGLSLFLVGNALCTPAIWSLIGMLYHKDDHKRESGSTLFYVVFNIGFFLSDISSGFVLQGIGKIGLLIYALPLFAGALIMLIIRNKFSTFKEKEAGCRLPRLHNKRNVTVLIITSIILTPICLILLNYVLINSILLWLFLVFSLLYILFISFRLFKNPDQKRIKEGKRMFAFFILCLIGFSYFIIFNSEFGLLPLYAEHNLNRVVAGITFPSGSLTSLDPLYCVLLGFIYSAMWDKLSQMNKNPALATKFSYGLILASIGYLLLALLIFTNISSTYSILWLLLIFFFFVSGELMVFPIGIAMAGKLAAEGKEGLLMGVWNLIIGASAVFVGFIASFTITPKGATLTQSNTQFMQVFLSIGLIVLIVGVVMFAIRKLINRLI
ncbi:peptide MFS transporter [Fangia hongkongensis]|uniref:peptide MFS transporter n=1 Tax=Fangia hongkongensis TaxID=270495 RepID=UPI00035E5BC0|nr:oligopeptide:H+ symporter [Fangia hongkongensis]MBK2126372.1 MFS transporter [Fangia hongkongensis]